MYTKTVINISVDVIKMVWTWGRYPAPPPIMGVNKDRHGI